MDAEHITAVIITAIFFGTLAFASWLERTFGR